MTDNGMGMGTMNDAMENTIRALVAYGDTVGASAFDLMFASGADELSEADDAAVRQIVRDNLGMDLSDTLVDEILAAMGDDDDDMYND